MPESIQETEDCNLDWDYLDAIVEAKQQQNAERDQIQNQAPQPASTAAPVAQQWTNQPPATFQQQQPIQQQLHHPPAHGDNCLRQRVLGFRHQEAIGAFGPPPNPYPRCPGVYGKGCSGQLVWWTSQDTNCPRFYKCDSYQTRSCQFSYVPPKRLLSPQLSLEIATADTFRIVPVLGAWEAVDACGGVEAVLQGAGVDISQYGALSQDSSSNNSNELRFPMAAYDAIKHNLEHYHRQHHIELLNSRNSCIPPPTLKSFRTPTAGKATQQEVEARYALMPKYLEVALLPFQREGVRFCLERQARCLIGDEMGVGKTVQAIATASCYRADAWPLLVIAPASMRLVWAEELEKWLPDISPHQIRVIEGKADRVDPNNLPQVTVTSYTMMEHLCCNACKKSNKWQQENGVAANTSRERMESIAKCRDMHCMACMDWKFIIIDESHTLRTNQKHEIDSDRTEAVRSATKHAQHVLMLSGTPSLNKPFDLYNQVDMLKRGLLGTNRNIFGNVYCHKRLVPVFGQQGKLRHDASGLTRATELHLLLRQEVMLRRLKKDVLSQLPPKRRQIVRLPYPAKEEWPPKPVPIVAGAEPSAVASFAVQKHHADKSDESDVDSDPESPQKPQQRQQQQRCDNSGSGYQQQKVEEEEDKEQQPPRAMSNMHRVALAKCKSAVEWLLDALGCEHRRGRKGGRRRASFSAEDVGDDDDDDGSGNNNNATQDVGDGTGGGGSKSTDPKVLVFAHHKDVMNRLAAELDHALGGGQLYVRIDGATDAIDRRTAVSRFRDDPSIRVALLSITAAGTGLDFSSSSAVVFVELHDSISDLRQAEDRAHRQGQINPVNIYFLCARGTVDERRWQGLSASLARVDSVHDGTATATDIHHQNRNPNNNNNNGGGNGEVGNDDEEEAVLPVVGGLLVDVVHTQQTQGQEEHNGGVGVSLPPSLKQEALGDVVPIVNAAGAADVVGLDTQPVVVDATTTTVPGVVGVVESDMNVKGQQEAEEEEEIPPTQPIEEAFNEEEEDAMLCSPAQTQPIPLVAQEQQQQVVDGSGGNEPDVEVIVISDSEEEEKQEQKQQSLDVIDLVAESQEQQQPAEAQQQQPTNTTKDGSIAVDQTEQQLQSPTASVQFWFQVSPNSNRIHFHCSDDGNHPLRLNLPGEALLIPECPILSQLTDAVKAVLERDSSDKSGGGRCPPVVLPGVGVIAIDMSLLCSGDGSKNAVVVYPNVASGSGGNTSNTLQQNQQHHQQQQQVLANLQAAFSACKTFVAEWHELAALKRSKLVGKLLQAPLDEAVDAVMEKASAAGAHGISTDRVLAPGRPDLLSLMPTGADLKIVTVAFNKHQVGNYEQPFAADGVTRLCINCASVVPGGEAVKVETPLENMRLLFCGGACEGKYALKCNSSAIRRALLKLERGVCVQCGLDCEAMVRRLRNIEKGSKHWRERRLELLKNSYPAFVAACGKVMVDALVADARAGNAWQADHIVPVFEGGGLCDIDNLRTLCSGCHKAVTKQQAHTRGARRRAAKKAAMTPAEKAKRAPKRQKVVINDSDDEREHNQQSIEDFLVDEGMQQRKPQAAPKPRRRRSKKTETVAADDGEKKD